MSALTTEGILADVDAALAALDRDGHTGGKGRHRRLLHGRHRRHDRWSAARARRRRVVLRRRCDRGPIRRRAADRDRAVAAHPLARVVRRRGHQHPGRPDRAAARGRGRGRPYRPSWCATQARSTASTATSGRTTTTRRPRRTPGSGPSPSCANRSAESVRGRLLRPRSSWPADAARRPAPRYRRR